MKSLFVISLLCLSLTSCKVNFKTEIQKGLVSFSSFPAFINDRIKFKAQIELPEEGYPLNIEYRIMDGSSLVDSGLVLANYTYYDQKNFYESSLVNISLNKEKYSGKTLSVILDPALKNTLPSFGSEAFLVYRRQEIFIP